MAVRKIENSNPKTNGEISKKEKKCREPSLEAQSQLVEILNDSPHLVSLAGTEWEVRTLRFGTQYLIAQEVIKVNKAESATFGDILKQFAVNMPSVVKIVTLCLLNDRKRIFKDGDETLGYSKEYKALYNTIKWEGNINEYGSLFLECLQLLDTTAFFQALDMLQIFRASVTMRRTTDEQK